MKVVYLGDYFPRSIDRGRSEEEAGKKANVLEHIATVGNHSLRGVMRRLGADLWEYVFQGPGTVLLVSVVWEHVGTLSCTWVQSPVSHVVAQAPSVGNPKCRASEPWILLGVTPKQKTKQNKKNSREAQMVRSITSQPQKDMAAGLSTVLWLASDTSGVFVPWLFQQSPHRVHACAGPECSLSRVLDTSTLSFLRNTLLKDGEWHHYHCCYLDLCPKTWIKMYEPSSKYREAQEACRCADSGFIILF